MYESDWESKDVQRQQMGCALYFIDQLALRAGHEKDEDEADTVGCCTLKVPHPPPTLAPYAAACLCYTDHKQAAVALVALRTSMQLLHL